MEVLTAGVSGIFYAMSQSVALKFAFCNLGNLMAVVMIYLTIELS